MGVTPQILSGKVMHKRLLPKVNGFSYGIYYLSVPLSRIKDLPLPYNRFGPLSFYDRDHGPCDGDNLESWARKTLNDYDIGEADGEIVLIAMPRVLGYVFNPVSFWLCFDQEKQLRAVLCEVHNTFGERHTYLCARKDGRAIGREDVLEGEKLFHVSPFLKREGYYTYRFDVRDDTFGVWIDFYDADGKKQLITSLIGRFEPMTRESLRTAFRRHPLVTLKAVALIHWQALKLVAKGIRYIRKPAQKAEKTSAARNLTKM